MDADLASVRERLARVEAWGEAHDRASEARHREVLAALDGLGERIVVVERQSWKLSAMLALVGVGGGAGSVGVWQVLGG